MTSLSDKIELETPEQLFKFSSIEKFRDWVQQELDYWNAMLPHRENWSPYNTIYTTQSNLTQAATLLSDALGADTVEQKQTLIEQAKASVQSAYHSSHAPILSNSPEGAIVKRVFDLQGQSAMAGAVSMALNRNLGNVGKNFRLGELMFVAMKYTSAQHLSAKAKAEITRLAKKASSKAEESLEQIDTLAFNQEQTAIDIAHQTKLLQRRRKAVSKYLEKATNIQKEKLDAVVSNIQKEASNVTTELEETRNTYEQFMSLKAPADYWNGKSETHDTNRKAGLKYGLISTGVIFLIAFVATGLGWLSPPTGEVSSAILIQFYLTKIIFVSAAIYIIRWFVKYTISEHHQYGNAKEKHIMIMTYLALYDENMVSEDQRSLVLQAIFTPSSDGLISDDAAAMPSLGDVVNVSKQSK